MFNYLKIFFFIIIAIVCGLGFYFRNEHPHFIWQRLPVFESVFGFLGCIVFVFVAKILGKILLQKEEDYYDD